MGHLKAVQNKRHYIKEPNWIIGFLLIVISIPIYSFSLLFASQTATSMVPTLSILFVMLWSWLLLNEQMTKYELYGTLFLAPGTIVVMISCNVIEGDPKSNAFTDYILSSQSVLFLSIIAGFFMVGGAVSMYIIRAHDKMDKNVEGHSDSTDDTESVGSSYSNQSLEDVLSYRWNLVPMIYFPWFAGMF
jgi:drug/metabolite transporter (DMT)-like permease